MDSEERSLGIAPVTRFVGVAAVVLLGCGNAGTNGDGSGGTSAQAGTAGAAQSGAGGGTGGNTADEVTSAADCHYDGAGGAIARSCVPATIAFSEPLPRRGLTFVIVTSEGDTFTELCTDPTDCGDLWVEGGGDALQKGLYLTNRSPNTTVDPVWIDVEVKQDGVVIGSDHFEPLEYACIANAGGHNWCWKSEAVVLTVNPASQ